MENRIRILFLTTSLVIGNLFLPAQSLLAAEEPVNADEPLEQVIDPEIERRNVKPPSIDAQDFEIGFFAGVMNVEDFGSNTVVGGQLAYHVTDKFFVSGTIGTTETSETSFELLSGAATLFPSDDRNLTYYDLSFGYHIFPGETFIGKNHALNNSFYVTAGAGNTKFADDNFFTWSLGFGYRLLLIDAIAAHFVFKDLVFDSDILGAEKTTHNLQGTVGISLFF